MRALSAGELKANRDNLGNWQIDPAALDDWLSMRRTHDRQSPVIKSGQPLVTYVDTPETLARIAAMEAENAGLRDRLIDTQAERDRLATMLEKVLEARPVQAPVIGFWGRLLGR